MLTLFELSGARPEIRFSPYVWRIKMMLEHKGLDYDTKTVTFTNKSALEGSGLNRVPVIKYGEKWVSESLDIARYLDATFPEKPLFESPLAAEQAVILNNWMDQNILMPVFMMIVADIHDTLDAESQVYFRETREPRIGCTIESTRSARDERRESFKASLAPIEAILANHDYLSGSVPAFADHCLMGPVMFAHIPSSFDPFAGSIPIQAWRERMFDQYGSFARKAPRAV
ncbi:glutathione S-transferase N-terminal domain-containing protein [Kordiimonas aquimaris]|uniref:glutathione S-transferase N-terminal domain-containing protein n=1 Tax=Kordiimonas aquimaris TaxID=707591 RepID=UPI0021CF7F1C|nr:glutathione S-transferase N-terminal domain-containing protein [Kordiimonas aquimaris]